MFEIEQVDRLAETSKGGRKPMMDRKKIALASKLMRDRETPIGEVCDAVGVSGTTLYRYLRPDGTPREATGGSTAGAARIRRAGGTGVYGPAARELMPSSAW